MSPDGERIGHALRTAASQQRDAASSPANTTRRTVAQGLRQCSSPVTASALATALHLHPNTVRNHLESLADDGLVHRAQAHTGTRGRPSTLYSPIEASLFPLDELASELSTALDNGDASEVARDAAAAWTPHSPSAQAAASIDDAVDNAVEALRDVGFESTRNAIGDEITMTECPYASLIEDHPEICAIHSELVHNVLNASQQPVALESVEVWVRPGVCRARLRRDDINPAFTIPDSPPAPATHRNEDRS